MLVRQRNALECRFIKQKFLWDSFIQYHSLTNQEKIISICLLTIRKAITVKAGQEATYIMRPPVNETSPKSSRGRIQYNTHVSHIPISLYNPCSAGSWHNCQNLNAQISIKWRKFQSNCHKVTDRGSSDTDNSTTSQ